MGWSIVNIDGVTDYNLQKILDFFLQINYVSDPAEITLVFTVCLSTHLGVSCFLCLNACHIYLNQLLIGHLTFYASSESETWGIQNSCFLSEAILAETLQVI